MAVLSHGLLFAPKNYHFVPILPSDNIFKIILKKKRICPILLAENKPAPGGAIRGGKDMFEKIRKKAGRLQKAGKGQEEHRCVICMRNLGDPGVSGWIRILRTNDELAFPCLL